MDMMKLRRMVMAQMARGKDFITGTFTCPDSDTSFTIEFGKTFNNYLFLIEMTDAQKTALVNSGSSASLSIAFTGVYAKRSINNVNVAGNTLCHRYKASDGTQTSSSTSNLTCGTTSIKNNVRQTSASNPHINFIRGYSYNFIVVSLD